MFNDALFDVLSSSWNSWKEDDIAIKPYEDNEYLVLTNRVNGLNDGISFYLTLNSDGTYSLTDKLLTSYLVNSQITNITPLMTDLAQMASEYGVLIDNQGAFINNGIPLDDLNVAVQNFAELLDNVVDFAQLRAR
ncbi:hypothetical protein [Lactobacillus sp. PV034]|uniref:hypothetical protein n=1 Tax=Lactobacillus sp. PV034 TaxID=2594495 RepID=UPI0022407504|nr:hypothetical protein [Lactobacillus sp. PV034]QNQ80508.1 hypothetical protein FP432_02545 [Lactobacillus sp. PV034]